MAHFSLKSLLNERGKNLATSETFTELQIQVPVDLLDEPNSATSNAFERTESFNDSLSCQRILNSSILSEYL